MIEKKIIFGGKNVWFACDGNCDKAWGINHRPRKNFDEKNPDDYAFLTDGELGEAPIDPGTYEGGHAKPIDDPEKPNKWCVRECERGEMFDTRDGIKLRPFNKLFYNIPSKHE